MHIESIHIERSGSLTGVTIDHLGPGVQVLHGTNETGKTSLLEFLRAMFFEAPLTETKVTYPLSYKFLLSGFALATVLFGIWVSPVMDWTRASLSQFYRG